MGESRNRNRKEERGREGVKERERDRDRQMTNRQTKIPEPRAVLGLSEAICLAYLSPRSPHISETSL